jgi:hypothetical protein
MNVGKAFEWLIIAVVVIIGGRWVLTILENTLGDNNVAPQVATPSAAPFIGWPYGTGVVYTAPGIVGPQWSAPGTVNNPWVGPGSPSQVGYTPSNFPKANPVINRNRLKAYGS